MGDKNSLKPFFNAFSKFKQIYFSLHTLEQEENKPLYVSDYAKAVLQVLNNLNVEKAHFICHSFGGRVLFKLHQICPYIIDKIILIDVAGLKTRPTLKKTFKKICFKTLKFFKCKNLDKFYSADYLAMDVRHRQTFKNIVNEHFDCYIKNIKNTALIIYGEKDKDTPVYMAKKLNKKMINSTLKIVKNAGHFSYIENYNVVLLAQFFISC